MFLNNCLKVVGAAVTYFYGVIICEGVCHIINAPMYDIHLHI